MLLISSKAKVRETLDPCKSPYTNRTPLQEIQTPASPTAKTSEDIQTEEAPFSISDASDQTLEEVYNYLRAVSRLLRPLPLEIITGLARYKSEYRHHLRRGLPMTRKKNARYREEEFKNRWFMDVTRNRRCTDRRSETAKIVIDLVRTMREKDGQTRSKTKRSSLHRKLQLLADDLQKYCEPAYASSRSIKDGANRTLVLLGRRPIERPFPRATL